MFFYGFVLQTQSFKRYFLIGRYWQTDVLDVFPSANITVNTIGIKLQ